MNAIEDSAVIDAESFALDFQVVKHPQEENAQPQLTSLSGCTPGCLTNNTCQTCTCQAGCISDIVHCGTLFTC